MAASSLASVQTAPALDSHTQSNYASKMASIIDIRRCKDDLDLRQGILDGMQVDGNKGKRMPTMLLYDAAGLKLFEEITFLDQYYLTNSEIKVLTTWAVDMARQIKPGSMIVELGSGNLRKTGILLEALEMMGQPFYYYALDLSLSELERTLSDIPTYDNVRTFGLHGTYDDGLEWLKQEGNSEKPKCIMSLGSSIGNFTREEAHGFLKGFADVLNSETDSLLIGLDGCQDKERVWHAYNDREGTTKKFILNGLVHANQILGSEVFNDKDWEYVGEYDEAAGRHQAFYWAKKALVYGDISVQEGERIGVEESYKYSAQQREDLWRKAGVTEFVTWGARSASNPYYVHMVVPQTVV